MVNLKSVPFTFTRTKCIVFVIFLILIILGSLLLIFWKSLVQSIINKQLSLSSTSTMMYKNWIELPIDITFEIYLWHWANSEEFDNGKKWAKPKFEQRGPYAFNVKEKRDNVHFNDNYTISFNSERQFVFAPELSKGSLDDVITIIHPVALAVANVVKDKPYLIRRGVHYYFEDFNITLAQTNTAMEFLFTGTKEILIDTGKLINLTGFQIPYDRFGWFYARNNSAYYDGNYTMWTGEDDISKAGIVTEWDGRPYTVEYGGECSKIDGTTGEVIHPLTEKEENELSMFIPDVCSKLTLERDGFYTNKGIEGYRYVSSYKIYDNGSQFPEMACFSPGEVVASGVRNISECQFKSPAFLSHPHFAYADPSYREAIEGMEPDLEKHKMDFVIEPNFGVPIKVAANIQANLRMVHVDDIGLFEHVETTMIPYLWCHVHGEIPDNYAFLLKLGIFMPTLGLIIGYVFLIIGFSLFGYLVFLEYKSIKGESRKISFEEGKKHQSKIV